MINRRFSGSRINPIWVLIGVNTVIFLASLFNPNLIYGRFGLNAGYFSEQPWTILTYMFVHAGFWHLLTNMLTLYFFGTFLMALVGETAFLTTYFAGGICGGLMFILLGPQMGSVVGASGAVFALGGALTMLRPNVRVYTLPIPIPVPLWVAVIFGFLILSLFPDISWQAHLGGLLYGLAVGYYFRGRERRGR